MRRLRRLGIGLIAIFALGVVVAGSASAAEPAGLLFLKGEKGFSFTTEGGAGELSTSKSEVKLKCEKVKGSGSSTETEHVTLGTGTLDIEGCKQVKEKSETSCNSKGDAAGVILIPIDFHIVSLEIGGKLVPGIAILPLVNNEKEKAFEFTCAAGTSIVLLKGWDLGEIKGASETADIEKVESNFIAAGFTCDKNDALCLKLVGESPFLAKLGAAFEKAELIQTAKTTGKPMMLSDF